MRTPAGMIVGLAALAIVVALGLAVAGASTLPVVAVLAISVAAVSAAALAALRQADGERLRWAAGLEMSSDWYWEMDSQLRFTYFTPNFADVAGIPIASVIGRRCEDIADAETRESASWRRHLADLAALRPFRDFAYGGIGVDGARRHFTISGKPLFDRAGRFIGYRGVGRDATALYRAESRLAGAIEAMSEGVVLWGPDDRLVVRNRALGRADPLCDDLARPGVSFAELLRARVACGGIPAAVGREEQFIDECVAWHRAPESAPLVVELAGGRCLQLVSSRMRDGSSVDILSDVTELTRREAERARAESRLVDAIEALSDGFTLWDADDRLVLWNSAAHRGDSGIYAPLREGVRYADLLRERVGTGRIVDAIGHEEEYIAERVASRRAPGSTPVVQRLSTGQWLRIAHHLTRDGGVVAVRSDITELKLHEAELERTRNRLIDAIEAMSDGFVLWDAADRLVVCNSAVARVDPAAAAVLTPGMHFEDYVRWRAASGSLPDAAGRADEFFRERTAWHRAASGEPIVQRMADGRWLRITQHRTRDGGIVGIRSDITALKANEEAVMRAESRLTDAIEAMSDGFVLWDAEDRLVLWNSAVDRADADAPGRLRHGIRYEDMLRARLAGGWVLDAVGREDAYLTERLAQRAQADGVASVRRLASGQWIRVSERRTREGGLVVIRTDVTELKTREFELIRARDEAQAASVAKTQFLATMSHELRTPLNAIIGFSELLVSEVYGPVGSPRYAGYAADIKASGQHLLALITDILDLSRIEAGRYELLPEALALGDLIGECLSMVRDQAEAHGIRLVVAVEPGLPALVADHRATKQILVNLLSNAVKFTHDGGRIVISVRGAAEGGATIAISDTGEGIAPDRLPRIFEPFQHVDANVRRGNQGAGLGLSICKRLADLQGLELAIASTVGDGTTATIRFPRTQAASAA